MRKVIAVFLGQDQWFKLGRVTGLTNSKSAARIGTLMPELSARVFLFPDHFSYTMRQELVQFNAKLRAKRTDLPELQAGDVVKIYRNIKEGNKERKQLFQGMVIAVKGGQSSSPVVTVRKVSSGVGVELVLPLLSPQIDRIELVKRTKARRGKLYYVRTKSAKVIGKKLKEVAFDIAKAGKEVKDVVKEVKEAEAAETVVAPTAEEAPKAE